MPKRASFRGNGTLRPAIHLRRSPREAQGIQIWPRPNLSAERTQTVERTVPWAKGFARRLRNRRRQRGIVPAADRVGRGNPPPVEAGDWRCPFNSASREPQFLAGWFRDSRRGGLRRQTERSLRLCDGCRGAAARSAIHLRRSPREAQGIQIWPRPNLSAERTQTAERTVPGAKGFARRLRNRRRQRGIVPATDRVGRGNPPPVEAGDWRCPFNSASREPQFMAGWFRDSRRGGFRRQAE
jgi:hypothetical protein